MLARDCRSLSSALPSSVTKLQGKRGVCLSPRSKEKPIEHNGPVHAGPRITKFRLESNVPFACEPPKNLGRLLHPISGLAGRGGGMAFSAVDWSTGKKRHPPLVELCGSGRWLGYRREKTTETAGEALCGFKVFGCVLFLSGVSFVFLFCYCFFFIASLSSEGGVNSFPRKSARLRKNGSL